MATVHIGLIQSACSSDPGANLSQTLAAAERAAKQGAQIICTEELFRSQYFCQVEDHQHFQLAEPIPGPTTAAFQKLAGDRQVDARQRVTKCGRAKLFGKLVVVAEPIIQCEVPRHSPRVLRKKRKRFIGKSAVRIAETLDKNARETKAVSLSGSKRRTAEGK